MRQMMRFGTSFAFMPGEATDCNRNQVPDKCEILDGDLPDANGNGRSDECEGCLADFNSDGIVDVFDILGFLEDFENRTPYTDLNRDGSHSIFDVIAFLGLFDDEPIGVLSQGARIDIAFGEDALISGVGVLQIRTRVALPLR